MTFDRVVRIFWRFLQYEYALKLCMTAFEIVILLTLAVLANAAIGLDRFEIFLYTSYYSK